MKRLIVIFAFLLIGLLLAACGGTAATAPVVEATVPSPTPPPVPTTVPAADSGQPTAEEPAAPLDESAPPAEQPTAEPPSADSSTFGTSAVDALAQDYVSCVETEPHPIGEQIANTYDVPYEEVMKLFCNGDTFDDILIAYQTRDLTGVGVGELLDMNAAFGSWDAVWQQLGLLDQ